MTLLASRVPERTDLEFFEGDDLEQPFVFTDDAGDALDLTGYAFAFRILTGFEDEGVTIFDLSIGDGITVEDNTVSARVTASQSTKLKAGSYYVYEFVETNPSGLKTTDSYGRLLLKKRSVS